MKTAIILDLDETLIHTFEDTNAIHKIKLLTDHKYIEERHNFFVLDFYDKSEEQQFHLFGMKRPYLEEFIDFCFNKFGIVIVWTAGSADYADSVVNNIFNVLPHFVFSREHCREFKHNLIKPLKDLFDYEPDLEKYTTLDHMIMLDDREENFILNNRNGIVVQPFYPKITKNHIETSDTNLKLAASLLKDILKQKGGTIGTLPKLIKL